MYSILVRMRSLFIYRCSVDTNLSLAYAEQGVRAGFPSPAQDFMELALDFNRDMIKNPLSTFYARVKGTSMIDDGIDDGDILVIDRSLEVREGALVVSAIDGEFTLKRIHKDGNRLFLMPANREFNPIEIKEEQDFMVWGVVIYIIKRP